MTSPMTDASGTASPSRYHHFASHRWQVMNVRSLPLTLIVIPMRSPWPHAGQEPWTFSSMLDMVVLIPPGANGLRASSVLAATGGAGVVLPSARCGPLPLGRAAAGDDVRRTGLGHPAELCLVP